MFSAMLVLLGAREAGCLTVDRWLPNTVTVFPLLIPAYIA